MGSVELMHVHSRHELRGEVDFATKATPTVCEIYSPPRVEPVARKKGFAPGHSLDLTTCDEEGRPWDFDDPDCRRRAEILLDQVKPTLLIGSPMCTYFSSLRNIFRRRMDPARFQYELTRARRHLEFVVHLYEKQAPGVPATSPMCAFGMLIRDGAGEVEGLARKNTTWMSNGEHIIKALDAQCSEDDSHVPLINGRAHQAQV